MSEPLLTTKLFIPPLREAIVPRKRLIGRLNEGLHRKLTLISASAGSGKTTLVSAWLSESARPAAWLSLDADDNEGARFVLHLHAALGTIGLPVEDGMIGLLQAYPPPSVKTVMMSMLEAISKRPDPFTLVLDDYHVIENKAIHEAMALWIERMPPHIHLVLITRADPALLPMARLRVRDQLNEVRTADLQFSLSETEAFLSRVMGLSVSREDIVLLQNRTEGWIAGLQLAALSMQGHASVHGFIHSFTGSHRYVLDYLVEEVLRQQPVHIQEFLQRTSILSRMCGPLCNAVVHGENLSTQAASFPGQEILEHLERANLFIVPLDEHRRWYRYHHLFAELLQQRLTHGMEGSKPIRREGVAELHLRASEWFEHHGLELEAFQHAASADAIDRAAQLIEGKGMPLLFRGAVTPVLNWLEGLPGKELDSRPSLRVLHASALLMVGRVGGVEPMLRAAERALQGAEQSEKERDLIGHIASIRATLAVSRHEAETIKAESHRALAYLHPDNLPVRTATTWTLGYAYELQGDRAAASRAYADALSESQRIGHLIISVMSLLGIGNMQLANNQLYAAADTYREVLNLAGNPPLPAACEAHKGLARIGYEWNDLASAEEHGRQAVYLARQFEHLDRAIDAEVFLAKVMLASGSVSEAGALLAQAEHAARQQRFLNLLPTIAEARVRVLLHTGKVDAAFELAQSHGLHSDQARVLMEQGEPSAAAKILAALRERAEEKGWEDERLKLLVLGAVALQATGEKVKAAQLLDEALATALPSGMIRIFLDEGLPMRKLLRDAVVHAEVEAYRNLLLDAFVLGERRDDGQPNCREAQPSESLIEPLSARELDILRLIAQGLSNHEISERLYLALSTVKGHNRNIFDKLQVKRRTEAVALARKLRLL